MQSCQETSLIWTFIRPLKFRSKSIARELSPSILVLIKGYFQWKKNYILVKILKIQKKAMSQCICRQLTSLTSWLQGCYWEMWKGTIKCWTALTSRLSFKKTRHKILQRNNNCSLLIENRSARTRKSKWFHLLIMKKASLKST